MASNIRRITAEIKEFESGMYTKDKIYYSPDPTDIYKGYALVLGSEDTPYENFPCYFALDIPADYPHVPPKVKFLTNYKGVRFHPNLYVEGKVCLSILGTWSGPSWAPIMKIATVLLSIQSILDKTPYCNEPGCKDSIPYNDAIIYYAMKYKLDHLFGSSTLNGSSLPPYEQVFQPVLKPLLPRIVEDMKKQCEKLEKRGTISHTTIPYGITPFSVNYGIMLPTIDALQCTYPCTATATP